MKIDHSGFEYKHDEESLEYYDRVFQQHIADGWDSAPGKQVILNAIARNILHVPKNGFIVDIGCGSGLLLTTIVSDLLSGWQATGIDFSSVAIDQAKKSYPFHNFLAEDGSNTSLPKECAHIVISYGSYEHFPEPRKGIEELSRILAPNGLFFVLVPSIEGYWGRTSENIKGWYPDKSGQLQWNLFRSDWEEMFFRNGLHLWSNDDVANYGAQNPDVFFLGCKKV